MSDYEPDNLNLQTLDDSGHMTTTEDLAVADSDDTGPGLDIGAQIHLQLSAISDKMDQVRCDATAKEQRRLDSQPNMLVKQRTANIGGMTTTQAALVVLGRPTMGRQWDIRSLIHLGMGNDVMLNSTAQTGVNVAWYVGVPPLPDNSIFTSTAQASLAPQVRWVQAAASFGTEVDKIGPKQIQVSANELLFAVISNNNGATLPAGLVWVVTALIADEPVKSGRTVATT